MKPLSLWMVAGVAIVAGSVGAFVTALSIQAGKTPLYVTPWLAALFLLLAIWLLAVGRGIRRLKRHQQTWVSPVLAGRTALFARSSAPICAGFSGFLLAVSVVTFGRAWAEALLSPAWFALGAAVGAGLATIASIVVERLAIDDGSDSDPDETERVPGGGPRPHHTMQGYSDRVHPSGDL